MKFLEDNKGAWPNAVILENKREGKAVTVGLEKLLKGEKLNKRSLSYKLIHEMSQQLLCS